MATVDQLAAELISGKAVENAYDQTEDRSDAPLAQPPSARTYGRRGTIVSVAIGLFAGGILAWISTAQGALR